MMLASMLEELIQDQDFLEFISQEVEVEEVEVEEVEVEEVEEGEMEEGEMEEEDSMVESPKSMMDRRSTLMGAM
jgi:hypothetical protein